MTKFKRESSLAHNFIPLLYFTLSWFHAYDYAKLIVPTDLVTVSPNFKWRFQKFKRTNTKTEKIEVSPDFGSQDDVKTIYGGLTQPIGQHTLKEFKDIYEANMGAKSIVAKDHIEYANLKEFLQSLVELGIEEAADAIKEEAL